MKIHRLTLTNFRGFADATLDLDRPLTVLFGPNGSGKSTVLEALAVVFSEVLKHALPDQRVWIFDTTDEDVRLGSESLALLGDVSNGTVRKPVRIERRRKVERHAKARDTSLMRLFGAAPLLPVYYGASRAVAGAGDAFAPEEKDPHDRKPAAPPALRDALAVGTLRFRSLFAWFKEREDAENARKVSEGDLTLEDGQLSAVRRAVAGMLPGFSGLRVQRDPLHMVIRKQDQLLAIDQLSDGEKLLLALAADLARRLAMVTPEGDPLRGEAVVLIDEIELHLHPAWQRLVLTRLRTTFPGCQFVVTTHSPQVLSEVPNDAVVLVKDFAFVQAGAPTAGRDTNAILSEVMDTPERPEAQRAALREVSQLIDGGRYEEAREKLDALERAVTARDREVVGLRTMLHFLEGDDAADSQAP
jgi:predicted ATP-binding protein involved in virulence